MISTRNLLRGHYDTYGTSFDEGDDIHFTKRYPSLTSNNLMIMSEHQQPSRTTTASRSQEINNQDQNPQTSTARQAADNKEDDSWLQLGLGVSPPPSSAAAAAARTTNRPSSSSSSSLQFHAPQQHRAPWGWNSNLMNIGGSSSSPSLMPRQYSPMMMMMPQFYNVQRFPFPASTAAAAMPVRVVGPPARQQIGVWFLLKAAEHQVREPFLPQIPKSYIRIKDGRMTVRLLMKYLVNKLGLDNESEGKGGKREKKKNM